MKIVGELLLRGVGPPVHQSSIEQHNDDCVAVSRSLCSNAVKGALHRNLECKYFSLDQLPRDAGCAVSNQDCGNFGYGHHNAAPLAEKEGEPRESGCFALSPLVLALHSSVTAQGPPVNTIRKTTMTLMPQIMIYLLDLLKMRTLGKVSFELCPMELRQ
jgi:hypothetical protein